MTWCPTLAAAAVATSLALGACASEMAERSPVADPASSQAEEAPAARRPELNRPDPLLDARAAESKNLGSPDGGARAADYSCPMHPEVRSRAPGECPKCGMTLVPGGGS